MKLAMKLRTRLFLSISALITVALLGLVLGLVSVMQMAKTQESLIRSNFSITLDLGLKLRQSLGDQLIMMLEKRPDPDALQASTQHYFDLLTRASPMSRSTAKTMASARHARITRICSRRLTNPSRHHRLRAARKSSPRPSTYCATA